MQFPLFHDSTRGRKKVEKSEQPTNVLNLKKTRVYFQNLCLFASLTSTFNQESKPCALETLKH